MLELSHISKDYQTARGPLSILRDINLTFERGDAVAIMGPSGSGKSTLLYLLGGLEPPTAGTITLDGCDPYTLSERELSHFRNRNVGFVFQDHYLLPQCTVLENVLIPTLVAEGRGDEYLARAKSLLERVGLSDRLDHRPSELSGGERQRAALARALIASPPLLLCDEPTGNLDQESAENVAGLLLELHRQMRTILIVVTHSETLAARFPTRYLVRHRELRVM
ncbi:MAG: ABC transporter ATP-binding protein [Acidobacteria bacterium]|nr:ABC transporter ATP-binding protein [Acidobacteriota bacterium]